MVSDTGPGRGRKAAFLDRDGTLLVEGDFLTNEADMRIIEGAPEATRRLADGGFALVVVTNQAVIARGIATEALVAEIHAALGDRLVAAGGAPIDAYYVCPHHPHAELPRYRLECACRKPRPGMILRAAEEMGLDLEASYMVGDRITDVAAGARAGCRTVLVECGAHLEPPIVTLEPLEEGLEPDHTSADIAQAVDWILARG